MEENSLSNNARQLALWAKQVDTFIDNGQYESALPLARNLAEQTSVEHGETSVDYAEQLLRLADVYRGLGKFSQATSLYKQAADLFSRARGENDKSVSVSLNGLATALMDGHEYTSVESILCRALAIDVKTVGDADDRYFDTLHNLGMLKFHQGKYSEAEALLQRTLKARLNRGENDPGVAAILNDLAGLYEAMKSIAAADEYFKRALRIRRALDSPLDLAQSLNNLALFYRRSGNYSEAIPLYRESYELYREHLSENHPRTVRVLNNLAGLYFGLDDFGRAKPLVESALQAARADGDPWTISGRLNNMGALHFKTQNLEAAERVYREALQLRRRAVGNQHPQLRTILDNLATLYMLKRQVSDALDLTHEILAIDDDLIANVFPIISERQRIAYLDSIQQTVDDMLFLISGHFADSTSVVCDGLDIVLRRKGIVAESIAARRDELLTGKYPALAPKLSELRRLRTLLGELAPAPPDRGDVQTRLNLLAELGQEAEAIEVELGRAITELRLDQRLRLADRKRVAQALPEMGVLVEFVRFTPRDVLVEPGQESTRYAAFVMEAREPDKIRFVDLGSAEVIDDLVLKFRKSISPMPNLLARAAEHFRWGEHAKLGQDLRSRVFDPLCIIPDDRRHIFLATEGALAWLPFEILPALDHGYLLDQHQMTYLSVGRDLLRFELVSPPSTEPLVVADPNFNLEDTATSQPVKRPQPRNIEARYFPPLPGTRPESEAICRMLGVQPVLGEAAVEGRLKEVRSPRVLHLATHGFFDPPPPSDSVEQMPAGNDEWRVGRGARLAVSGLENALLRSGLAFAGANTWTAGGTLPAAAEDGILYAVEVSSLDLVGTDLAVLSACDTALGTVHVWEGVFGLRRAFALAGAKTLIMSLWKVADRQTAVLMSEFYRQLLGGTPRGESLRRAQLALKKKYPSPYFWGAFICQGDPRSMNLTPIAAAAATPSGVPGKLPSRQCTLPRALALVRSRIRAR